MNNVEKIKQEAQNLRDKLNDRVNENEFIAGEVFILNYFLSYIDLHNEPVSEDLEEAAENYAFTDEVLPNGKVMIDFQAEKAFKAGAEWQKQQMMAKAVNGTLIEGDLIRQEGITHPSHSGEKVKLVIIKED